jgi:hypothetical protein
MKNLILIFFFSLSASFNSYSQPEILKSCDDMTDKCYYVPSEKIVLIDEVLKRGFNMGPRFEENRGKLEMTDILCKVANIGACHEADKLIIMFSDGSKLTLTSWNKFNCEGDAWFSVTESEIAKLASFKVIKAYLQNGRSYDSLTMEIPEAKGEYFIRLISDMRQGIVKEID